ncbi:MAG: hypothetical protein LBR76_07790 [Oscillospiraceae bacterium]|nr:hypothetical protein [Oscillospiraceae bacterium]
MKTKHFAILLAALLMFMAFAACASEQAASPTPDVAADSPTPADTVPSESGDQSWDPSPVVNEIGPVPEGAIDFSDGNMGYMAINLTPGGADPSELEIIDFNGAKALKINVVENGQPYLGIDVSSMFGDKVADIRSIEARIYADNPNGDGFYAMSGNILTWTGADLTETAYLWGVAVERNNPRTTVAELTKFFEPGQKNIAIITKTYDAIKDANTTATTSYNDRKALAAEEGTEFTEEPPVDRPINNVIIDYILFKDEAGNPMVPDTTVSFVPPQGFGDADRTMLYALEEEASIDFLQDGATGTSANWGQAGKVLDLDLSVIQPGAVFTVYYKSEKAPELIFQSWGAEGTEVPESVTALNNWVKVSPYTTNLSGNIAQYRYEDIVAASGAETFDWVNCVNIGDWGVDLTVNKFSVGQRTAELGYKPYVAGHDGYIDLTPYNSISPDEYTPFKSVGAWQLNFRVNTTVVPETGADSVGEFEPEWLVPGAYIIAYYLSEEGAQFCVQRYATEDKSVKEIFGGGDAINDPLGFSDPLIGIDMISAEALIQGWIDKGGTAEDIYTNLNAFWIQNRNKDMDLFKVVLYTPNFNLSADDAAAE